MSQEYLMRYPLVKGQGQLGTQENNEMFSSSRYTEAKPAIFADLMFNDFKKNVVPMKETYNGEFMEPVILPSLFPNALCNGRQAIGISMAHNSAPHNLTEVCNAAIALLQKGSLTIDELLEYIPGPDFPLGGKVLNAKDIKEAFETGKSRTSLKVQGDYIIEGQKIIFNTIPYRTYRNKIKEQIEKNVDTLSEYIDDFDDESNIGQNKLIFYVKKSVTPDKALNQLFLLTDLQTTISYNMNYIVNGTPKLCSMIDLLQAYINHQEDVLINATYYDKEKAEARAHILEGLIAAVGQIDKVIELIKQASDRKAAKAQLITFLSIDEIQADAILDMKLGKLTRIDKEELVNELEEKKAFIKECNNILNGYDYRKEVLIQRITELKNKYGDARRTQLLNVEAPKKEKKEEPIPEPEDCLVVISSSNMIKRVSTKGIKTQRRNTAGMKNTALFTAATNTLDTLMVFTSKGKMYRLSVNNIPDGTNASVGVALSTLIKFEDDEIPLKYTTMSRDCPKNYIIFGTKNGLIKKVPLTEYDNMKRTGIVAIKLREGDEIADITFIDDEDILLISREGKSIRIAAADIPISSRIAQGVKGMGLNEGDQVARVLCIHSAEEYLAVISQNGIGKKFPVKDLNVQHRGGKGVIVGKEIGGAELVSEGDKLLITGNNSSIAINESELPEVSRTAAGNIILKDNTEILSVIKY